MSTNRQIGRVLSVDNFRVFIKIDEDLRGSYKSGMHDIYEVARINSYLIIPVGAEKVVALITRVSMKEEIDLDKNSSTIKLPTAARYISATMLGTITNINNVGKFIQGVYNFPTLDNPVWYVTESDLQHIFDDKQNLEQIDFSNDYYLPIGTSPSFSNYKVKICPDLFFAKHAAILGNTGSGKSCTLTSILRNLFRFKYNNKELKSANIIIFDTNGEYKNAFLPEPEIESKKQLELINAYYYGGENQLKVPYWFMNWEDYKYILQPSEGTQAPVLKKAIGLAKNEQKIEENNFLPQDLYDEVVKIINGDFEFIKKKTGHIDYGNWSFGRSENAQDNELMSLGKAIINYNEELGNKVVELSTQENFNDAAKLEPVKREISRLFLELQKNRSTRIIESEANIDMPTWFSYKDLCGKFLDSALQQNIVNNSKLGEFVSTLRLRMNGFLNDRRIAVPLMLKESEEGDKEKILYHFISFLFGDFNKLWIEGDSESFIKKYNSEHLPKDVAKSSQITIVDVSQLPFEVLETVTALLGRIIIEFVSHFLPKERGKYPIVIVLEEAQNYIADKTDSIAKKVFERIAREGRKYGISLVVCSQRPSELSKTVLSQCNSYIIHRLQNPEDQMYVKGLVSSASSDILDQLPIIPQQHAIITGDCVRTPIQVRIDDVTPTPNSHNPEYVNSWLKDENIKYEDVCMRWMEVKKTDNNNNE